MDTNRETLDVTMILCVHDRLPLTDHCLDAQLINDDFILRSSRLSKCSIRPNGSTHDSKASHVVAGCDPQPCKLTGKVSLGPGASRDAVVTQSGHYENGHNPSLRKQRDGKLIGRVEPNDAWSTRRKKATK